MLKRFLQRLAAFVPLLESGVPSPGELTTAGGGERNSDTVMLCPLAKESCASARTFSAQDGRYLRVAQVVGGFVTCLQTLQRCSTPGRSTCS